MPGDIPAFLSAFIAKKFSVDFLMTMKWNWCNGWSPWRLIRPTSARRGIYKKISTAGSRANISAVVASCHVPGSLA
jgi:hypothetical protein